VPAAALRASLVIQLAVVAALVERNLLLVLV
jgi:hypothetical protein